MLAQRTSALAQAWKKIVNSGDVFVAEGRLQLATQQVYVPNSLRGQSAAITVSTFSGPSRPDFEAFGRPSEGPRNLVEKFMLERFPVFFGPLQHSILFEALRLPQRVSDK